MLSRKTWHYSQNDRRDLAKYYDTSSADIKQKTTQVYRKATSGAYSNLLSQSITKPTTHYLAMKWFNKMCYLISATLAKLKRDIYNSANIRSERKTFFCIIDSTVWTMLLRYKHMQYVMTYTYYFLLAIMFQYKLSLYSYSQLYVLNVVIFCWKVKPWECLYM